MNIEQTIYTTSQLLLSMQDPQFPAAPSDYWLSLCFPNEVTFDEEFIDFEKITRQRKLAPLVVPLAQGRPMYSEASKVQRVKPAYLKPKDPVSPTRIIRRRPGNITGPAQTPQQRYNALVTDIQREHRDGIARRWEWMACQAVLYGEVTLEDDGYPVRIVDFERHTDHSITLGMGERWGDSGVSPLADIQTWRTMARQRPFGGITNRLTVGSSAYEALIEDASVRELLKNDSFRNNSNGGIDLNLGLRDGLEVEFVGRLSANLEVWVYSDYYQDETGAAVPFMDPRDVVLTGPNIQGYRCFGAILDKKAGFQALPLFPKMWDQEDPSVTHVMTQSAPLMVPVNPNASVRARVIA